MGREHPCIGTGEGGGLVPTGEPRGADWQAGARGTGAPGPVEGIENPGSPDPLSPWRDLLESGNYEQRTAALRRVVLEKPQGWLDLCLNMALLDEHPLPRAEAGVILEGSPDQTVTDRCALLLFSNNRTVRRRAYRLLLKMGVPGAGSLIDVLDCKLTVPCLCQKEPGDEHKNNLLRARRAAADTLGRMGAAQAVPSLCRTAGPGEDVSLRCKSLEALARIGAWAEALPVLQGALEDGDLRVRRAAMGACRELACLPCASLLVESTIWDHEELAIEGAEALAECLRNGALTLEQKRAQEGSAQPPPVTTPPRPEVISRLQELWSKGPVPAAGVCLRFLEPASTLTPLLPGEDQQEQGTPPTPDWFNSITARAAVLPRSPGALPPPSPTWVREALDLINDPGTPPPRLLSAIRLLGREEDSLELARAALQHLSKQGEGRQDPSVIYLARLALEGKLTRTSLARRVGARPTADALSASFPYGLPERTGTDHSRHGPKGAGDQEARPSLPVAVAAMNLSFGKNIGTLIRSAEACNAREFFIVGQSGYHLGAAKGTNHYIPVHHLADLDTFLAQASARGYVIVAVQQCNNAEPYQEVRLPPSPVFLLGSEGKGLPDSALLAADLVVEIPMGGMIDSLNVAVAGSLVLYEWMRQQGGLAPPGE